MYIATYLLDTCKCDVHLEGLDILFQGVSKAIKKVICGEELSEERTRLKMVPLELSLT